MRARTRVVTFALCALMMFGFAITAQAQIIHSVTQQNNEVVQYGLTELMGEVRLTAANAANTTPSTITITYLGAQINNVPSGTPSISVVAGVGTLTYPNGVSLTVSGNYATNFLTVPRVSINVINTALGGQIILSIPTSFAVAITDSIRVNGARTDVSAKAIGATIAASISSTPSNANLFDQVNVTVATVNKSMELLTAPKTIPICTTPTNPSVWVTEGFSGAFVQYTTGAANPRPRFGATTDTHVRIQVNNLPSGVSLSWPSTVVGTTLQGIGASQASLVLVASLSTPPSVVVYRYTTLNQGTSDNQKEQFIITPVVTVPATSGFGQSTAQAQLFPDATFSTIVRFAHPLVNDPPNNFLAITKCVTYLLYPFVTGNAIPGFTTGIAVANTSADDAAFGGAGTGAVAQSGAVTLFGWQNSTKAADGSSTATLAPPFAGTSPVTAIVSTSLSAGDTWAGVIDAAAGFSGFQGYVIAKCDFQFGHGFAFIVGKYNSGSVFDVAHGYLALVIPDPTIVPRVTTAGESLGQ